MSWIATVWRSVSKNTRGAPPVIAELSNTGFVACGVMKVSGALTAAKVCGAAAARLASWLMAFLLDGRPTDVGAASGCRQRVCFR